MCLGGGGGDGGAAARAAEQEKTRQTNITKGTQEITDAFSGFNDDFYAGRKQSYLDYANPELDDQYAQAKKKLNFALDRRGLSASTAAADQQKKLEEQYNKYGADVISKALGYSNQTKTDVENTRSNLLSQLYATEDPSAAASSAVNRASVLSAAPDFDPLSSFVFDLSSALQRENAAQGYTGLASSPLFSSSGTKGVTYVG